MSPLFLTQEEIPEEVTQNWPEASLVFVAAIVLAVVLRTLVVRAIDRSDSDRLAATVTGRFVAYVVVIAGLVYALRVLEAPLGPLLGALGIGGIALAFALQDIIGNFIAGIMLQIRRPFRRGDQIATNDYEGTVEDVNLRVVALRTFEGERVLIPNGMVLKNPLTNHTTLGRRRTTIMVGLAYDTDLDAARDVLLRAVEPIDDVLDDPAPEAYVEEFADSTINVAVRIWHRPDIATLWRVRDEAARSVKRALDAAGMEIAFPQLTLWLNRSEPVDVSLRQEGPTARDS